MNLKDIENEKARALILSGKPNMVRQMLDNRPDFLRQQFIDTAHRRFVKIKQTDEQAREREKRRDMGREEYTRRQEQSRRDRLAARQRK